MRITLRALAIVLGIHNAIGCRAPHPAPQPSPLLRDDAVVEVIERQVRAAANDLRVRIDPQPLPSVWDTTALPSGGALERDSMRVWEDVHSIVRVGLRAANTHGSCAGPLAPDSLHVGCPTHPELVVVIGQPRAGGLRELRPDSTDTVATSERDDWTVRVFVSEVQRQGFAGLTVFDYVLRRSERRLTLIRIVPLLVVE